MVDPPVPTALGKPDAEREKGRGRADRVLVARGLFESRAQARAAMEAGFVTADGETVRRPAAPIGIDAALTADRPHPYVSRGGVKLAAALDAFALDPAGLACLDVGASTGGFTDVLLRRGAAHVAAVDVGRGQFHPRLADDPRVSLREGTDVRGLAPADFAAAPDLACIDVSFIALRLVVPPVLALLAPRAALVCLIKPQFEAGREAVGRGGIVRDPAVREAVCAQVAALLAAQGLAVLGPIPSPIAGGDGNREFLIGGRRG
jgi:23S rRNA (cytidine1920-2'-O)/16S rRNA (cytidine1409-2'-O)-methyltransferase